MKRILPICLFLLALTDVFGQFRTNRRKIDTSTEIDYSLPQEYEIADIKITGIKVLDENALISLTGLKKGDRIKVPGDEISSAIKKLWEHGLIGDASIYIDKKELGKVNLIIELTERARLTGISFEGVSKSRESKIREDLDLLTGRVLSDAIVKNAEITVKKHYIEKGFLNAEVKIIRKVDTLNREGVNLKIVVNKKGRIRIHKINIEGNENIGASKIKKQMKSTNERVRFTLLEKLADGIFTFNFRKAKVFIDSTNQMSWKDIKIFITDNVKLNFFNTSKYIKNEFETDKNAIIAFYNTKGYRDIAILMDTMYRHDDNSINIDIKVNEGKKYYFRNITWVGNYVHTNKTLNAILDIDKGDVYNIELINRKLSFNPNGLDISGLYMDDGYLFFNVTPVETGIVGDSIDVEMRIYEGEQATINKVIVKGNDRTSDHVILRELRTLPGQKFSRFNIIQSQQRLSQLGYFDPEKITPTPLPNPANGTVDIEWSVVEKSSDQIQLSGGWGGSFGFVGTLGLTFNNFSLKNIPHFDKWRPLPVGDGQRFSLSFQANGKQFQSYNVSFSEPWLGGRKPNSLSVSFNHSVQRASVAEVGLNGELIGRAFNDFNASLKVTGVTLGLGRRLEWPDSYFTLTNSIRFVVYTLSNYRTQGLGFSDGTSNSITLNTTLSRNSIDNPTYPKNGLSISLNLALAPPHSFWRDLDYENVGNAKKYKWIEYHKWLFDVKHYFNLVEKLVLESKANFGFIGSYSSKVGIGPFERFYLGGDGLAGQNFLLGTEIIGLRGYENNAITPPYGIEGSSENIRGGIIYNKFSFELRYPVTTGQAATIYVFGFGEAGNNWYDRDDFYPFDIYKAAGVGTRIFMPAFGLIGLNWGYGFDTLPGKSERSGAQFHFTIGQQLR